MQTNTFRFFFVIAFALVFVGKNNAQTTSPYSRFGLGFLRPEVFSSNKAMGEIAGGVRSAYSLNPENPASYSELIYTTFETGASVDLSTIATRDSSYNGAYGTINHLAIGLPLKRGVWGASVGLLPYSTTNYTFAEQFTDTSKLYQGTGSLYKLYLGTAYKIGDFSVGVNFGYLFGKNSYYKGYEFTDSLDAFNVRNNTAMRVSGFLYDVGIQYKKRIAKHTEENRFKTDIFVTAGIYGHSESPASTTTSSNWERYYINSDGVKIPIDTPLSVGDKKGKMVLPYKLGVGFTIGNENWWIIGADFKYTHWSVYSSDLNNGSLANSWRFSFGAGITPDFTGKFLKRINYKVGFYVEKPEVLAKNASLQAYGGTLGITFPFLFGRERVGFNDFCQIYLMGDIGSRIPQNKTLISETYYRITLGLVFNAQWFQKRKFD